MSLVQALFALLIVYMPPHGGEAVLAPHIRARGGYAYVTELAGWVDRAAELEGLNPYLLAQVLVLESSGDPTRVEPSTGAAGLMQLHPDSPWGQAWRRACALEPAHCDELNVLIGASVLRAGFETCHGDPVQAVSFYRSGRCLPRRKVRERSQWVVRQAQELERHHARAWVHEEWTAP